MQKSKLLCRFATFYKHEKGFTIIEALVVLFIFALITTTFYSVFAVGTKYIIESKNRLGALAIANEKMEIVRNLKYNDIGTAQGEIGGNIPQDELVIENTRQYNVHTLVEYVDDPIDGLLYEDSVWFEDYKNVTVTVSWGDGTDSKKVELVSTFAPQGREVEHPGDGILIVNVSSDSDITGKTVYISDSRVRVYNPETGIDVYKYTNSSGNAIFMGSNVSDSIKKYQVTATKDDYETIETQPPFPETSYDPRDMHASVVTNTGTPNYAYIAQNKMADDLKISTIDYLDQPIPSVKFDIVGGRKMGNEHAEPRDIIYNMKSSETTNSSGEKDFGSVSPGTYTVSLSSLETNFEIIGIDPNSSFLLPSDGSINLKMKLAKKNETSLLVKVVSDSEGNPPISGAEVKLSNVGGYDATQTSNFQGNVFFPKTSDVFQDGTYDLKITADGFQEKNSQVIVDSGALKIELVILTGS